MTRDQYKKAVKDAHEYLDAPIKADRWRNLWFLKTGESDFGYMVHPTEEEARRVAENDLRMHRDVDIPYTTQFNGMTVLWSGISHFIPMPIKD